LIAAALAVAVGVVVFAVAGGSGDAQATGPGDNRYQELLAEKLGISVEELQAAQKAARDALIDEKVAAGDLTEEQAERLKNREPGAFRGLGPRLGARVFHALKDVLGAAAEVIGVTPEEARQGIANGNSLVEQAQAKGISEADLKASVLKKLEAQIDEAVNNDKLTEEQATRIKEGLEEHIDRFLNAEGPPAGKGFGFRFHGRPPLPPPGDSQ
jgi:polyhydroxyalkanoate synthesis regulator phasin